jgi:hypothetical protein
MNMKYSVEMLSTTPGRIGGHKNVYEYRIVRTASRKTGHLVGEIHVIDRRHDRYYKRMVHTVIGEIVLETDEKLSDHTGRGGLRD